MLRTIATLIALTAILGYVVVYYGGVLARHQAIWLLSIGVSGLAAWLLPSTGRALCPERRLWLPMVLFSGYLIFQIVPLPLSVVRVLSPARADLIRGLEPIGIPGSFASLSVMPSATFGHLLRILGYSLVFLLVREAILELSGHPWIIALPIVLVGGVEAVIGIMQYAADPALSVSKGTYINRNHFAGLLEMALPFAVMYAVLLFNGMGRVRSLSVFAALRLVAVAGTAVAMCLAIVYSLSRMGFVSAVCGLLVIGVFLLRVRLPRKLTLMCASATVLVILVVLIPDRTVARFADIAHEHELSRDTRVQVWADTLKLIAAYPVFGCGAGAYAFAFPKYQTAAPFLTADFAHNDYLQAVAELGVVGFLIVAFFVIQLVATAVRAGVTETVLERRALGVACVAAWAAILAHSASDFNLYIPANAMLLAWIAGITAGLWPAYQRRNTMSVGNVTFVDVKGVVVK